MKNYKKIASCALCVGMLSSTAVFAEPETVEMNGLENYASIQVDGQTKPVRSFLSNGTTYIALRDISEVLDCKVDWDDETKTAIITSESEQVATKPYTEELGETAEVTMSALFDYVTVEYNKNIVDVRNFLSDGTTYIALRDISEVLDCAVGWDGETKTALIATGAALTIGDTPISAGTYDEWYTTVSALQDSQDPAVIRKLVDSNLIYNVVLKNKVKEYNLANFDEVYASVEQELEALRQIYGDEELNAYLESLFITKDIYIEEAAVNVLSEFLVNHMLENFPEFKELEEKDLELYNKNKEDYKQHCVQVKHILIPTKNLETGEALSAEALKKAQDTATTLSKTATAETFDALIEEYSADAQPPEGYFVTNNGQFVEAFEQASLTLEKGEISTPVESEFGYHIILAVETYDYIPYEMIDKTELNHSMQTLFQNFMETWMHEIPVKINEDIMNVVVK